MFGKARGWDWRILTFAKNVHRWCSLRTMWYTCVHICWEVGMGTARVGIREFRDKLSNYLLESEAPLAITRHGDTVGYYIPARRKRSESERDALRQIAGQMQELLAAKGISEEEVLAEYKEWRAGGRK